MRALALIPAALLGCQPAAVDSAAKDTASGGRTVDPACLELGEQATLVTQHDVQTEEDFDFDARGNAVYQLGSAIVGTTVDGVQTILGTGVTTDPSGIQVGPDGRIVVAGQDSARLAALDPDTGSVVTLASNIDRPNGLEIDHDGLVYVSEFLDERASVQWIDPDTGDTGEVIRDLRYPNGIALSPSADTLYVVAERPNFKPVVIEVERTGERSWTGRSAVYADWDARLDGVEVDACGNLYILDYGSGALTRIDPETGEETVLITITDDHPSEHFSSLRWGSGVGGWHADHLYATDRAWLYGSTPAPPADRAPPSPTEPWRFVDSGRPFLG